MMFDLQLYLIKERNSDFLWLFKHSSNNMSGATESKYSLLTKES